MADISVRTPLARFDPVSGDLPGEAPWALVGGMTTVASGVGGDLRSTLSGSLQHARRRLTLVSAGRRSGLAHQRRPSLSDVTRNSGFPDGLYVVFVDAAPIRP